jgi:HEAT repeat protein
MSKKQKTIHDKQTIANRSINGVVLRRSFFVALFSLLFLFCPFIHAQEANEDAKASPVKDTRFDTIRFGTEAEIATLIQTLRTDGTDELDDDIIALVKNTRNRRILSGAFAFFGQREKSGLEDRAVRAIEGWDEEETETVTAAIDYVGKIRYEPAAPILKGLIDAGESRFMNSALRSLGMVSGSETAASQETAEFLINFYENREPANEIRRDLIFALGETGSSNVVPLLSSIATNTDERPVIRVAALEAIAKIGDQNGLGAVLENVSASDSSIRSAAVTALGPFSGQEVDAVILDAFRDAFHGTRTAAARASRERKLVEAVPYLKFRAERDEVPAVQEEAIRALGAIANSDAMQIMETLFTGRRNPDRIRIVSGEMLMQNDPDRFIGSLVEEMDEAKRRNLTALYNGFLRIVGNGT